MDFSILTLWSVFQNTIHKSKAGRCLSIYVELHFLYNTPAQLAMGCILHSPLDLLLPASSWLATQISSRRSVMTNSMLNISFNSSIDLLMYDLFCVYLLGIHL